MKNRGIYGLLVSILIVFSITACTKTVIVPEEIKNVKAQKVSLGTISTVVEYACKLKPIEEVAVSSKAPGKVASVNFSVGQRVNKGDVLFTLDSSDIKAQLDQQLLNAQQAVSKSQLGYDTAKYNYDKEMDAYEKLAVSKEEVMDSESKYNNALIDLSTAKENLRALVQGTAGVSVSYENTIIRSPINGIVSVKNVDVGEISSGSLAPFTIINSNVLNAEIYVSDKILEKIKIGEKMNIIVAAMENKKIEGIVDNISPATDDKTQSYIIKLKINNSDNIIKAGMFAKVSIPAEEKQNILIVSKSVIKIENGINFVYLAEKNKVKKVTVSTGIFDDKVIEILSNIKEGDFVITEGQIFLNEGDKIKIVD